MEDQYKNQKSDLLNKCQFGDLNIRIQKKLYDICNLSPYHEVLNNGTIVRVLDDKKKVVFKSHFLNDFKLDFLEFDKCDMFNIHNKVFIFIYKKIGDFDVWVSKKEDLSAKFTYQDKNDVIYWSDYPKGPMVEDKTDVVIELYRPKDKFKK